MPRRATEQARKELHERLCGRRAEIEGAILTRALSVADSSNATVDPAYVDGLRIAVTASLDYALTAVELGEERSPPPPPALLAQVRLAVRIGVSLDTVLRRCFAGHALFSDFMVEEAETGSLFERAELKSPLRTQASIFDRLLAAVSEEYEREAKEHNRSTRQRHSQRIERLLDGELVDTQELGYPFDGWHLGAVGQGADAVRALRELAIPLNRRLLLVEREEGAVWAWLGSRRESDPGELQSQLSSRWPEQLPLALGEPARGVEGWRFTHRQARAALPIALRGEEKVVRYGEVALLATILQDDLLAASLRKIYLEPLEDERDGGKILRETLRAYFAAERNVSSAAVALGVRRHTVANRLRMIEERLGRSLSSCIAEMEAALLLDDLDNSSSPDTRQLMYR